MSQNPKTDIRRYARFEFLDYATIQSRDGGRSISAAIVDVGLGGVQIRAKDELKQGDEIVVSIANDLGTLKINARVTHARKLEDDEFFAVGCQFWPVSHEERIAIATYVHSVFQRQGERLTG